MTSSLQQKIARLLCERGEYLFPKQIATLLGVKENSVRTTLRRMEKKGLVARKDHLYVAKEIVRKEWLEKLVYEVEDIQTKYHGICYTLQIDGSYDKAKDWTEGGIGCREKIIDSIQPKITIRVFSNNNATIYIGATSRPLTSKDISQADKVIDAILQAKFNAPLRNYRIGHIEANTDVINATLQPSTIEIRQGKRLFRIYEKTIDGIPFVRIETRHYGKPLNLTKNDIKPFVTNSILYDKIKKLQQQLNNQQKQLDNNAYISQIISKTLQALLQSHYKLINPPNHCHFVNNRQPRRKKLQRNISSVQHP